MDSLTTAKRVCIQTSREYLPKYQKRRSPSYERGVAHVRSEMQLFDRKKKEVVSWASDRLHEAVFHNGSTHFLLIFHFISGRGEFEAIDHR